MTCCLIWLYVLTLALTVSYGREVYYKLGSGHRYGPCQEEEVLQWAKQGHFDNEAVSISTIDEPDIYIPSSAYFEHYKSLKLNKINILKSIAKSSPKKLFKHLGKTLGPLTKTKIMQQTNPNGVLQPMAVDVDYVNDATELSNDVRHQEISSVPVPADESEPEEFSELVGENNNDNIYQSIDDEMLHEIKRDNQYVDSFNRQQHSTTENEQNEPIIDKISIKSLASDTERLWAEDIHKRSSTVDIYNDKDILDSSYNERYARSVASIPHSVSKGICILLYEVCRLFGIIFGRFIPAVVRHSGATLITLLSSSEGRVVALWLLLQSAVSLLRFYLYLSLIPNILLPLLEPTVSTTSSSSSSSNPSKPEDFMNIFTESATVNSHSSKQSNTGIIIQVLNSAGDLGNTVPESVVSISSIVESITSQRNLSFSKIFTSILYTLQHLFTNFYNVNISVQRIIIILSLLHTIQIVILPWIETNLLRVYNYMKETQLNLMEKNGKHLIKDDNGAATLCGVDIMRITAATITKLIFGIAVTQLVYQYISKYPLLIPGRMKEVTSRVWVPLTVAVSFGVLELYMQPSPDQSSSSIASENIVRESESFSFPELNQLLARISSLCDTLQDPGTFVDCQQWGLLSYVRDLLRGHTLQLEQHAATAVHTVTSEVNADTTVTTMWSHRYSVSDGIMLARRLLLSMAVLVVSLSCWTADEKSLVAVGDQVDLANIILGSVRQPPSLTSWTVNNIGACILHYLLIVPIEKLQHLVTTFTILGQREGYLNTFIPNIVRKSGEISSRNMQFFMVLVLLMPSVVLQRVFMNLDSIARISSQRQEGSYTRHQANEGAHSSTSILETTLQRAREILAVEAVSAIGFTEKEPVLILDANSGYEDREDLAAATVGMEVEVRKVDGDISLNQTDVESQIMKFPTGGITVILGNSNAVADTFLVDISETLIGQRNRFNETTDHHARSTSRVVTLYGHPVTHWSSSKLRNQVLYYTGKERHLPLPAGALAGMLPGIPAFKRKQVLRAHVASGAHTTLADLSRRESYLSASDSIDEAGGHPLLPEQWRSLHLSRTLCQVSDKTIILLTNPTQYMSIAQEKLFFEYLRNVIQPSQMVVLSSMRDSTRQYADQVYSLSTEGRIQTTVTSPVGVVIEDSNADGADIMDT